MKTTLAALFTVALLSSALARADLFEDVKKGAKKAGKDLEKAGKKAKKAVEKGAKATKEAAEDAAEATQEAADKAAEAAGKAAEDVKEEITQQAKEAASLDDFDGTGACVKCDGEPKDGLSSRPDGCSVPKEMTDSTTSRGREVFQPACDRHDRCYGTPGVLQKNCDERFRKSMLESCERLSKEKPLDPFNVLCKTTAETWAKFVRGLGSGNVIGGGYQSGQAWLKKNNCKRAEGPCKKGWTSLDSGKTAD